MRAGVSPRRGSVGYRALSQPLLVRSVGGHDINLLVPVAIRRKCNARSISRPRCMTLVCRVVSQLGHAGTIRVHRKDFDPVGDLVLENTNSVIGIVRIHSVNSSSPLSPPTPRTYAIRLIVGTAIAVAGSDTLSLESTAVTVNSYFVALSTPSVSRDSTPGSTS